MKVGAVKKPTLQKWGICTS